MAECFCLSMVEVQERRLLAFLQFADSVTGPSKVTLDRKRALRKNTGLLSENPHKVLSGWSQQFSQEREENFNFNSRPRTVAFAYQ